MKTKLYAFLEKTLTSRKVWAIVSAIVLSHLGPEWHEAVKALELYVLAQGSVDAAGAFKKPEPERVDRMEVSVDA